MGEVRSKIRLAVAHSHTLSFTGLEELPAEGFEFFAVPQLVEGMGTFPVRAFAILR